MPRPVWIVVVPEDDDVAVPGDDVVVVDDEDDEDDDEDEDDEDDEDEDDDDGTNIRVAAMSGARAASISRAVAGCRRAAWITPACAAVSGVLAASGIACDSFVI